MSFLYSLDLNPLLNICFANIFSHSVPLLFHFVDSCLCCAEDFSLMLSHLFIFAFVAIAFGVKYEKSL